MIEEYTVFSWTKWFNGGYNSYLSEGVEEMIKQGWQPIGGICVDKNVFYQAMVRYKQ